MDRLDTTDGTGLAADQQGLGGRHDAIAGDALQQITLGDAGGGEDDVVILRHIFQLEHLVHVDAQGFAAGNLLLAQLAHVRAVALDPVTGHQASLHITIQGTDHRRGDHPFRRATDAVQHVDFAIRQAGEDGGGHVAVRDGEHPYA